MRSIKQLVIVLITSMLFTTFTINEVFAISDGEPVATPQSSYPMVVSIFGYNNTCTGTLIKQQIVLTAAHCVVDKGMLEIGIRVSSLASPGPYVIPDKVWIHPLFDLQSLSNDIALLYLSKSARVSQLGKLPKPNMPLSNKGLILGWGEKSIDNVTGRLNRLLLTSLSYETNTISGGGSNGGACKGDSGGPLFNGTTKTIIGVISSGGLCGSSTPGEFIRIDYYLNDIYAGIKELQN
jgi:secreted trypsin-like serine protease